MNLTIHMNLPRFAQNLRDIANRLQNLQPAIQVGAAQAVSEAQQRFQTGIGPDGKKWPALVQPRPIRGSFGDKPLLNTGQMRASLAWELTGRGFKYGTAQVPKARTQQYGATLLPKRGGWMSIPLTREAALAGSPRDFPRKLRKVYLTEGVTFGGGMFLVDNDRKRTKHYRLIKKAVVPPRPFIGVSDRWIRWFSGMLVGYVLTGRTDQGTW